MKYFVRIDTVILHQGSSHTLAQEALTIAINIMRQVKGTGTIYYATADTKGQHNYINGTELTN